MKIREVSVQQINAALNDLTRDIDIKIKQIESLNNEIKNMQSKLEALTKAVNGDFTALDEAIGDNIEYINNNFVPNTRTVNGKALNQNISLTASDVGALPDSTVIPAVVDSVTSGNMNAVTSNAVANYDPVTAKGYMPKKYYTIDATGLSTSYFYPVTFDPNDLELDCEIHSENRGGEDPYNQNLIHFLLISQGWSDTPPRFVVLCAGNYDNSEITIGSVWRGNESGVNCVYVRGGRTYRFVCNRTPVLRTSDYSYGNEVCRVTTDANGNMTAGSRYWSYTQNGYGSYFKDVIQGTITEAQHASYSDSSGSSTSCSGNSATATKTLKMVADFSSDTGVAFDTYCMRYGQSDGSFDGRSGWAHYLVFNHGDGASYFHYTVAFPFWDVPCYKRQTGSTSSVTPWYNFNTTEKTVLPIGGTHTTNGEIWIG